MKKIVDDKGRLFGKVNVVDMLVIAVIVAVLGAVIYRVTSSAMNADGTNIVTDPQTDVYISLYANSVVPEVAEALKVGDKLVNGGKFIDAEIVSIETTPAAYITTNSDGEPLQMEHPMWNDIYVVVKGKASPSSPTLKIDNQEIRINYTYLLKTQVAEVNCRIRGLEFK